MDNINPTQSAQFSQTSMDPVKSDRIEGALEELKEHFGPDALKSGSEINSDYGHDEMETVFHLPDILIMPTCTEDVSQVLRIADRYEIPVVARGGGTGLVGGSVAVEGGIMIDLAGMNKIIGIDVTNAMLITQPGVLLKDVAAYAKDHGFLYAPDPGEKTATIGGNISTNAGGMRAVKYGVTRNSVEAITVVTASGDIVNLGGIVSKNSSGFDLKDLIIGSEGTLAIVTEARLKLFPLPKFSTSLLIPFNDYHAAISNVPRILATGIRPTALEFFEEDSIALWENYAHDSFPEKGFKAYLLLTFDGASQQAIEEAYEETAELCLAHEAADVFVLDDQSLSDQVWRARDSFLEAFKNSTSQMDEIDAVVPVGSLADMVDFTHSYSENNGIRIGGFGHAGNGNLHLYICRDDLNDRDWRTKLRLAFDALYGKAYELQGKISGEHGIGYAKRDYLVATTQPQVLTMMRAVKRALDPKNILNPQKVI